MTGLLADLGAVLVALGYGVASALVPVFNAEAYAVVASTRTQPVLAGAVACALAVGQTVGKLILFEASRQGSGRLARRFGHKVRDTRVERWSGRLRAWLSRRRTGLPTVFCSALVGVPPLLVVSVVAGTSQQRRWEFAAVCVAGRILRFVALTIPGLALF